MNWQDRPGSARDLPLHLTQVHCIRDRIDIDHQRRRAPLPIERKLPRPPEQFIERDPAGRLDEELISILALQPGNGRLGRLLVTLLLEEWRQLSQPLLYLSLFFKRRREDYYRILNRIRTEGDWEGWTAFFLEGVATIAEEAVQSARDLFALVSRDRARVLAGGKATVVASRLFEELPRHPVVTITGAVKLLGTTKPTAAKAIALLEKAGVLAETTGRRRDRTFSYAKYLDRLRVGTELE